MPADVEGEPQAAIMRATYRALCANGYADLTMQDIADEAPVSKGALHYHYDSKRGLFEAFQAYIAERFLARLQAADDPGAPAPERLSAVLDAALSPPETDELRDLQRALLELTAQAPHEPAIAAELETWDGRVRELLAGIVADGIETGAFASEVDPETTATFVATVLAGAQTRQVSVDQSPVTARALLETHLETRLVAEGE
jgi:AcrR family transcriptional regulator